MTTGTVLGDLFFEAPTAIQYACLDPQSTHWNPHRALLTEWDAAVQRCLEEVQNSAENDRCEAQRIAALEESKRKASRQDFVARLTKMAQDVSAWEVAENARKKVDVHDKKRERECQLWNSEEEACNHRLAMSIGAAASDTSAFLSTYWLPMRGRSSGEGLRSPKKHDAASILYQKSSSSECCRAIGDALICCYLEFIPSELLPSSVEGLIREAENAFGFRAYRQAHDLLTRAIDSWGLYAHHHEDRTVESNSAHDNTSADPSIVPNDETERRNFSSIPTSPPPQRRSNSTTSPLPFRRSPHPPSSPTPPISSCVLSKKHLRGLAICYSNRSVCHYVLRNFRCCLRDCHAALSILGEGKDNNENQVKEQQGPLSKSWSFSAEARNANTAREWYYPTCQLRAFRCLLLLLKLNEAEEFAKMSFPLAFFDVIASSTSVVDATTTLFSSQPHFNILREDWEAFQILCSIGKASLCGAGNNNCGMSTGAPPSSRLLKLQRLVTELIPHHIRFDELYVCEAIQNAFASIPSNKQTIRTEHPQLPASVLLFVRDTIEKLIFDARSNRTSNVGDKASSSKHRSSSVSGIDSDAEGVSSSTSSSSLPPEYWYWHGYLLLATAIVSPIGVSSSQHAASNSAWGDATEVLYEVQASLFMATSNNLLDPSYRRRAVKLLNLVRGVEQHRSLSVQARAQGRYEAAAAHLESSIGLLSAAFHEEESTTMDSEQYEESGSDATVLGVRPSRQSSSSFFGSSQQGPFPRYEGLQRKLFRCIPSCPRLCASLHTELSFLYFQHFQQRDTPKNSSMVASYVEASIMLVRCAVQHADEGIAYLRPQIPETQQRTPQPGNLLNEAERMISTELRSVFCILLHQRAKALLTQALILAKAPTNIYMDSPGENRTEICSTLLRAARCDAEELVKLQPFNAQYTHFLSKFPSSVECDAQQRAAENFFSQEEEEKPLKGDQRQGRRPSSTTSPVDETNTPPPFPPHTKKTPSSSQRRTGDEQQGTRKGSTAGGGPSSSGSRRFSSSNPSRSPPPPPTPTQHQGVYDGEEEEHSDDDNGDPDVEGVHAPSSWGRRPQAQSGGTASSKPTPPSSSSSFPSSHQRPTNNKKPPQPPKEPRYYSSNAQRPPREPTSPPPPPPPPSVALHGTLYGVLGLASAQCEPRAIVRAFRELALKWHPDRWIGGGTSTSCEELPSSSSSTPSDAFELQKVLTLDPGQRMKYAEEKFKKVRHAYEILSNAGTRKDYNESIGVA